MPRRLLGLVVISLVIGLAVSAAALGYRGFRTYPTCGGGGDTDYRCIVGNGWGAVLTSNRRDVHYRLCVTPPDGERNCFRKDTGRPGDPSFVRLYARYDRVGEYDLRWYWRGDLLDHDELQLDIGD